MILVYILMFYGTMNPMPPMSDLASCERVRAASGSSAARCIPVLIPAPGQHAWNSHPHEMPK